MRVIVIGANGMLGTDLLVAAKAAGFDVSGVDLPEVNLTVPDTLPAHLPDADWWINCAAYTRVDDAESETEAAYAVNAEGVRHLAEYAAKRAVRLLHISTDYVFDGRSEAPYSEHDRPNPLSVYGASKLAGEKAVQAAGGSYSIVRTQSLFGLHGPNFIKAIVRKLETSDEPLTVVADQFSAPTYTRHLAEGLCRLLPLAVQGIWHVTASGSCSWHALAQAIVDRVRPGHPVMPITAADLQRPARRPTHAVLCNDRYAEFTGHRLPDWTEGLDAYLKASTQ